MKQRRRRSGTADTPAEVEQMSKPELDFAIQHCIWGYERPGTSQSRRAFFKRLVWLEKQREDLFGIPAPKRRFSPR